MKFFPTIVIYFNNFSLLFLLNYVLPNAIKAVLSVISLLITVNVRLEFLIIFLLFSFDAFMLLLTFWGILVLFFDEH